MNTFQSVDEVLDFAIEREEEAFVFYSDLANSGKSSAMREMFNDFAHEELGHKAKLLAIKNGRSFVMTQRKIDHGGRGISGRPASTDGVFAKLYGSR